MFADLPPAVPERCAVTPSARRSDVAAGFTRRNTLGPGPVFPITRLLVRGAGPVVDGGKPIHGALRAQGAVDSRATLPPRQSRSRAPGLDGTGDMGFAENGRASRGRTAPGRIARVLAAWRGRAWDHGPVT